MYYPCSENKDADQLRGYREADLRLCFRPCKLLVFSRTGSNKSLSCLLVILPPTEKEINLRIGFYFLQYFNPDNKQTTFIHQSRTVLLSPLFPIVMFLSTSHRHTCMRWLVGLLEFKLVVISISSPDIIIESS